MMTDHAALPSFLAEQTVLPPESDPICVQCEEPMSSHVEPSQSMTLFGRTFATECWNRAEQSLRTTIASHVEGIRPVYRPRVRTWLCVLAFWVAASLIVWSRA